MFRGNKIYKVDKNGNKRRVFGIKGVKIRFKGRNSTILIHEPIAKFRKCIFVCSDNCFIEIHDSRYKLKNLYILAHADNSRCEIGRDFSCTNGCKILLHKEPSLSVTIGDDCMFGTDVVLRTTDAHTIYSATTQKVSNFGKSISIGNHCWLAMDVTVSKGVEIADNSIVGTKSLVTKNCETPNAVYVGAPAKLVKTDVNWDRKTPCEFDKNLLKI